MKRTLIVLGLSICTLGAATAAEIEQRFSIARTADGYIRTDIATGETSICNEKDGQLICRLAADDRQAYDTDIASLQSKIDSLEKRISALEKGGPLNPSVGTSPETDAEFQTSMNRMEQFFRRFMGIVKEFQQFGDETPAGPNKT
jgi:hypothetical protein